MKLTEAIKVLENHNKWRRRDYGVTVHPIELGVAIDAVVDDFRNPRTGECNHPFNRLHWVDDVVFCNKCRKTLNKIIDRKTLRPCDCKDQVNADKLNEQGIQHNDQGIVVSPNSVILTMGHAEIKIPMQRFKMFAEWYLEPQDISK